MFKILGILLALYVVQSVVSGRIFVKSGLWGRTLTREESKEFFWIAVAIYSGLSVALLTVF